MIERVAEPTSGKNGEAPAPVPANPHLHTDNTQKR
jgi:hypothetical protein